MANEKWCPVGRADGGPNGGVDYYHVWQWVYVPGMMDFAAVDGGLHYEDVGGMLIGRCIYCGATWEESGDGDD